ncbi:hypothetical protein N0V85_004546 [Neurospora sp. IMI 360204]|nr:hypothetical protein N0V85_004546 [Neurospora sp. IMI 360204]
MPEHTSDKHSIVTKMASPTGTDNDSDRAVTTANDLAVTPLTISNDVIATMKDNEEEANIILPTTTRSYCHVLSVVEVIELAKRLDLDGSISQNTADTAKNSEGLQTDGKHEMIPDNVACTLRQRPTTEDSAKTALSAQFSNSSTESAPEDQNAAVESTAPVPTIYQPRRPNIFKKRGMKRAARPVYVWSQDSGAGDVAKATETIDDDDGEGFTAEDLQEFQSAGAEKMERKTKRFLHMVSQYSWRPRRVEDLGEAFEIED